MTESPPGSQEDVSMDEEAVAMAMSLDNSFLLSAQEDNSICNKQKGLMPTHHDIFAKRNTVLKKKVFCCIYL